MKRKLSLIGFLLGLILIFLIVYFSNPLKVIKILGTTNINLFLAAFLLEMGIIFLFVKRLQVIVKPKKGFWQIFRISVYANAINLLTPILKIGGEPLKIIYLGRMKIKHAKAASFVAVEIFSEVLGLYSVLLLLIAIMSVKKLLPSSLLYPGLAAIILALLGFVFALRVLPSSSKIENILQKFLRKELAKEASAIFSKNFHRMIKDKRLIFKTLSLTFLSKFLELGRIMLVFLALNVKVTFELIALIWIAYAVIGMIPWLPGSLGIMEGGLISVLLIFGISNEIAVSFVLLDRFLSLWIPVLLGFGYKFWTKFVRKRKL